MSISRKNAPQKQAATEAVAINLRGDTSNEVSDTVQPKASMAKYNIQTVETKQSKGILT